MLATPALDCPPGADVSELVGSNILTKKGGRSASFFYLTVKWIYSISPKYLSASKAAMQPVPAAVTA